MPHSGSWEDPLPRNSSPWPLEASMENSYQTEDLIAALATPRGRGALAVVRTSGPGCVDTFAAVFSRSEILKNSEGNRVHYGWILDDGKKIDVSFIYADE